MGSSTNNGSSSSNSTATNLQHEALDAAKAVTRQVDETNFTLGGVLNHIYAEGIHKTAGYDGKRGFANYCKTELGIEYRKAMELRTIYIIYSQAGVDETRLSEIGLVEGEGVGTTGRRYAAQGLQRPRRVRCRAHSPGTYRTHQSHLSISDSAHWR